MDRGEAAGVGAMFVLKGHTEPIRSVAFTGDGRGVWTGGEDSTLVLWDRYDGQSLRRLSLAQVLQARPIEQLVPLEGGSVLVRGNNAAFRIDAPENGRTRVQALPLGSHRRTLAISPDGKSMAILAPDELLEVRSTDRGQVQSIYSLEGLYRPGIAAFSPDGSWLIVGDSDGKIHNYPASDSGPPTAIWEHERAIFMGGSFSADSRTLALAGGRSVHLVEMPGRNPRQVALAGSDAVFFRCVAFSPDGTKLAVGRWDGEVLLFDTLDGRQINSYRFHGGSVHSVAFAPDGLTAASGGDDYLARIWDVDR